MPMKGKRDCRIGQRKRSWSCDESWATSPSCKEYLWREGCPSEVPTWEGTKLEFRASLAWPMTWYKVPPECVVLQRQHLNLLCLWPQPQWLGQRVPSWRGSAFSRAGPYSAMYPSCQNNIPSLDDVFSGQVASANMINWLTGPSPGPPALLEQGETRIYTQHIGASISSFSSNLFACNSRCNELIRGELLCFN